MVSVQEAFSIVMAHPYKPHNVTVPVAEVVGRVLGEKIRADRDFPPFHRVAMDGIAIHFEAWEGGKKKFSIESVQAAGQPQKKLQQRDRCIEVMTGAVLPEGTDTVIRYEDLTITDKEAILSLDSLQRFQNVHKQGQDARQGEILLEPGIIISPAEVALLASVGKSAVDVLSFPKAAIVASGDELVAVDALPEPYQIRRSNGYAILAGMKKTNWEGVQFHLPDQKDILKKSLETIISENDVVILSGGVSKGKFDYLPEVLEELGIKKLFHQVNQRPGKPFWFGSSAQGKIVFALPGNPVSTFMCFHRFIRPWLYNSWGLIPPKTEAILATDFNFEPKLTHFLQVAVKNEGGRLMAYPKAGGGSGDFANLKDVDGFLELPPEKTFFKAGEVFPFTAFRD
jgi:molybdopterin molybdotransferase